MVLRHQVRVLERQLHARVRYRPADRAILAVLSRLLSRDRWRSSRSVRKLEPHLNPPARTRGSVRPDGRVDVSVSDGAGDAGADCLEWALLVEEQPFPASGSPERVPGAGDARCSGGRNCEGRARGGLRRRPTGG